MKIGEVRIKGGGVAREGAIFFLRKIGRVYVGRWRDETVLGREGGTSRKGW